jgi:23S rRNA (uracil1939-C5)-methyltransferase
MVDIENCPLISQAMQAVSLYIKNHRKILRVPDKCEITVRQSSLGQIMIIFSGNQTSQIDFALLTDHCKEISFYSIDQNITRLHYGETRLEEKLGEFKFEISPLAFFQVNHQQNEKMLAVIKDYARLQRSDSLLDAYCGTGSIALSLAREVKRVVGVENFKAAIKDAKRNAFLNNITNTQFIKGACEEIVPALTDDFDVIILDPPRSGCKKELIQEVINKSPRSLIYVSCNPATLARDLALFEDSVYQVKEIQPIDMFPQTSHVETVVLITRAKD